ncbi:MAG: hypothetical protein JXA79_00315, partial [Deltaproteobacteria bacterium]|nr:hypothetical protein [Deltaproteobacteria bacterium]
TTSKITHKKILFRQDFYDDKEFCLSACRQRSRLRGGRGRKAKRPKINPVNIETPKESAIFTAEPQGTRMNTDFFLTAAEEATGDIF